MKESQVAVMDEFIDNVKILINALGYRVLEPVLHKQEENAASLDDEMLSIEIGNVKASGKVTTEGFVVLKGSTVNEKTSDKSLSPGAVKLREKYFQDGHVKALALTEDILFSSSSAAADFILGYSVSGPRTWKNAEGKALKELEEKEVQG